MAGVGLHRERIQRLGEMSCPHRIVVAIGPYKSQASLTFQSPTITMASGGRELLT